jgi:serine/threonine-protein kinase
MLLQVIESEPPRPTQLNKHVPLPLERICLKCLEKDPKKRYESAAALVDDLEHFLRGEPLQASPPGVWRSLVRWGRREPTLASHLAALAIASTIVQFRYLVAGYDLGFHLLVMGIFGVWAILSVVCHGLMRRAAKPDLIQYAWAAADVICLTWMLEINDAPPGPLLVGYPLLIVASGLFFRVRLVCFITALCVPAYLTLILSGKESLERPHYTLIYIAVLIVIGFIVGYQAYRVRVLSRYLENT